MPKTKTLKLICLVCAVALFGLEWATDGFEKAVDFAVLFSMGWAVGYRERE